jgi:hypothetical protein
LDSHPDSEASRAFQAIVEKILKTAKAREETT